MFTLYPARLMISIIMSDSYLCIDTCRKFGLDASLETHTYLAQNSSGLVFANQKLENIYFL